MEVSCSDAKFQGLSFFPIILVPSTQRLHQTHCSHSFSTPYGGEKEVHNWAALSLSEMMRPVDTTLNSPLHSSHKKLFGYPKNYLEDLRRYNRGLYMMRISSINREWNHNPPSLKRLPTRLRKRTYEDGHTQNEFSAGPRDCSKLV